MNEVERPIFHEGQVVAAADLDSVVDYGRDHDARHDRYLHTWGIAEGLALTSEPRRTAKDQEYVAVTLNEGVALDGSGREVVVTEALAVDSDLFDQSGVAISDPEAKAWYPIFLEGRDREAAAAAELLGPCDSGAARRVQEGFSLAFGRPGDEQELDSQLEIEAADGPVGGLGREAWKVLLGFVRWDDDSKRFVEVAESNDEGVGRRYAGVRADEVTARSGHLVLRSTEQASGKKPALRLRESDSGAELCFGVEDASGQLTSLFKVDSKGDVVVAGEINAAGSVLVESGTAFDGVLVPLPKGVTQKQVDDGQVALHIHVTPHYPGPSALPSGFLRVPVECRTRERRVHCQFRRWELADTTNVRDEPGLCDYTVMAFLSARKGGDA